MSRVSPNAQVGKVELSRARRVAIAVAAAGLALAGCTHFNSEPSVEETQPQSEQLSPNFTYPEGETPRELSPQQKCVDKINEIKARINGLEYNYDNPAIINYQLDMLVGTLGYFYGEGQNTQIPLDDGSELVVPDYSDDNQANYGFANRFEGCEVFSGDYVMTEPTTNEYTLSVRFDGKEYSFISTKGGITTGNGSGLTPEALNVLAGILSDVNSLDTAGLPIEEVPTEELYTYNA